MKFLSVSFLFFVKYSGPSVSLDTTVDDEHSLLSKDCQAHNRWRRARPRTFLYLDGHLKMKTEKNRFQQTRENGFTLGRRPRSSGRFCHLAERLSIPCVVPPSSGFYQRVRGASGRLRLPSSSGRFLRAVGCRVASFSCLRRGTGFRRVRPKMRRSERRRGLCANANKLVAGIGIGKGKSLMSPPSPSAAHRRSRFGGCRRRDAGPAVARETEANRVGRHGNPIALSAKDA